MRTPKISGAGWCWIGLGGYVTIADGRLIRSGKPSMSTGFGWALKNPRTRWPLLVAWAALTLHLFADLLPPWMRRLARWVDPIGYLARMLER